MSVSFSTTSEAPLHETGKMCENLDGFKESYNSVHGYICLVICIFGAVANLLNIIVLTRKEMNGSPINRILTGEPTCDPHDLRPSKEKVISTDEKRPFQRS